MSDKKQNILNARKKGMREVYQKISQKKQKKSEEEAKLAKELKEIKLQRQYLNANRAMVEEKAWKELEAGAERQVRSAQKNKLVDQCKVNSINVKDGTVRAKYNKETVLKKVNKDDEYREILEERKK